MSTQPQGLEAELELDRLADEAMRAWPAFCADPKNAATVHALQDAYRALQVQHSVAELLRPRVYR